MHNFHQYRSPKFARYHLKIHIVMIFVIFNVKTISHELCVYISALLKHNAAIFRIEMSKGGKVVGSTEVGKNETSHG